VDYVANHRSDDNDNDEHFATDAENAALDGAHQSHPD
jgi:hypothetical protein